MNSKEALEHIIFEAKAEKPIFSMYYQEFLKPIEQDLEILEIIKKHKLLNYVLKNEKCANMYHLSKEEIDLLREIENGNDWICNNTRN